MKKIKNFLTKWFGVTKFYIRTKFSEMKTIHASDYENDKSYTKIFNNTKCLIPILFLIFLIVLVSLLEVYGVIITIPASWYFREITLALRYKISKKIAIWIN